MVLLLLSVPWLAWTVVGSVQSMQNTPVRWIPAGHPERVQYEWFRSSFGIPDSVVVSWPGCTVDDARLQRFADAILVPGDPKLREAHRQSFDRVTTGYGAVRNMTREPLQLSRDQAMQRLSGFLVQPNGETSCAVVSLTEYGVGHPRQSLALIHDVLLDRLEIEPEQAFLAGRSVERVAIDRLSAQTMQYYLLPSGLLVLLLARLVLGRWRITLVLISVAAFGELFVLALVGLTGATMNAVLIVMAPLVFVLTVSAGVHLVNYYRDEIRHRGVEGAVGRALRSGWIPCVLAAVTTALGLVSLAVSEMTPVRQFGALSAIGVITTTGLLFLLLPEPMRRWGAGPIPPTPLEQNRERLLFAVKRRSPDKAFWGSLAALVDRRAYLIVVALGALLAVMIIGLTRLRTSVNVFSLLGRDSDTARDYRWLEANLAPMIPIEVILRADAKQKVDWLDRIRLLQVVQYQIEKLEGSGGTMSAATFVPRVPTGRGIRATVQRSVAREQIESQLDELEDSGYLHRTEDALSLRVTTRAPATTQVDYGRLMAKLRQQVEPVLDRYRQQQDLKIEAVYTGMTPLIHVSQEILLEDLISSFLTALLLVAIVIILVLQSIPAGLVAMVPNIFPAAVLFGAMGWFDIPVDIGSMMTASVAIGIAIDGTLHFVIWYRRETSGGATARAAVARTYSHCGNALWQTTIICGLGLLVFALSSFVPTRRFAWMMLFLLLLALVGDLLLLPALLTGPLRKFYVRQDKGGSEPEQM